MNPTNLQFKFMVLLGIAIFSGMLASCSDGSGDVDTELLRIYEMTAGEGTLAAVDGGDTNTVFRLSLSRLSDILYFTNRGAQEAGHDTVDNLINNVWPRVYGTVEPNAVIRFTAAGQGTTSSLLCILSHPVYDRTTGRLEFTVTYLEGRRPADNLALVDVKMIITNNAAQAQPQEWSTIMGGDIGMLEPTDAGGVYTLTIEGLHEYFLDFTCAPHRKSSMITANDLIQIWETRFGANPPNASLSFSPPSNPEGGVQVVVLTDPVYDENLNRIRFTAELLFGTAPIETGLTVNNPSLFIDGGDGDGFPTAVGNHFSIQYRNSTSQAATVWLNGAQPPCSLTEAPNCQAGLVPEKYSQDWEGMKDSFAKSGTQFFIHSKTTDTYSEIAVTNRIDLDPGETLRIVPPLDEKNNPQWYYANSATGVVETAGITGWATQKGIEMPAPMQVNLFEYNINYPGLNIWGDISGVDGINVNAAMSYEGEGCGDDATCGTGITMPRVIKTNIDAYDGNNDGCPYVMVFNGANTCPNPKHYPTTISGGNNPAWVVGTDAFTTDDVESDYSDIWTNAGSPTGLEMCSAASGDPNDKKAYHIWWATNNVSQGWLDYMQKNDSGRCDAYGWAYDEKRWKPGDKFDENGNPPDNTSVNPLFNGPMYDNTYINIDITKIM